MKNRLSAIKAILFNEHYVLITPSRLISCTPKDSGHLAMMNSVVAVLNKTPKKGKTNATKR